MRARSSDKQKAQRPTENVGFRLEQEYWQILRARADRLEIKLSPHNLAREYVKQALESEEELAAVHQAIRELHREISELREDVALTAETLLQASGKVTEEEARKWANDNFK